MPTPSDDHIPPTVDAIVTDTDIARHGCPPEDRREQLAPREEQRESPSPSARADRDSGSEHPAVDSMPVPSPEDTQSNETVESRDVPRRPSKAELNEDASVAADPSSPTVGSLSPPSDSDYKATQLAQSLSNTVISPEQDDTQLPLYLHYPELDWHRQTSPSSTTSFLRPGSKFRGTQQSDRQVYDVQVELKDVDLAESTLCGYLRIQGLTDDHPTLTTFFEGEIIGPKYLFRTSHPSWGSSEKVDLQHWARFPAWRPLAKAAKQNPAFTLSRSFDREHMFMRWKEYFLVPDHRVKTITGASFEGFYYICFNQASGAVSGIYFHAKSEKYQQLELSHVEDRGCLSAVEFR